MKVKKWKAGRGNVPGVIQVKLKNLPDGKVVLNVVGADGLRLPGGSVFTLGQGGLEPMGSMATNLGIATEGSWPKVRVIN